MRLQALKKEIEALKGSGNPPTTSSAISLAGDASNEDIATKLLNYQQFMAKYIVESHQQKVQAIKAAELAVAKQYEEKMRLLTGSTETAVPPAPVPASAASTEENKLYAERNAKVSAAAKAGKSRWGDMEVAKASKTPAPSSPPAPVVKKAVAAKKDDAPKKEPSPTNVGASIVGQVNGSVATPAEVVAADHGMRADGGVGGFTLAERVAMGTSVLEVNGASVNGAAGAPPVVAATATVASAAYQQRNAKITAAAKAGKSRWGTMELERVKSQATSLPSKASAPVAPVPVPPEVEAADHGLRADGGVGGPTLAERVNLGAKLLGN